jgi:hypothetical protein
LLAVLAEPAQHRSQIIDDRLLTRRSSQGFICFGRLMNAAMTLMSLYGLCKGLSVDIGWKLTYSGSMSVGPDVEPADGFIGLAKQLGQFERWRLLARRSP